MILSFALPEAWVFLLMMLLLPEFLATLRCIIRTGIPPKSKSSLSDFVKNLSSVSDNWFFPLINATKVGGRAFTWVKYFIFGWEELSFQECRLKTYTWIPHLYDKFYVSWLQWCTWMGGFSKTLRSQRLRRAVGNLRHHFSYVSTTWRITAIRPFPSSAETNTTGIPFTCMPKNFHYARMKIQIRQ